MEGERSIVFIIKNKRGKEKFITPKQEWPIYIRTSLKECSSIAEATRYIESMYYGEVYGK
jgi:hypothetical protein